MKYNIMKAALAAVTVILVVLLCMIPAYAADTATEAETETVAGEEVIKSPWEVYLEEKIIPIVFSVLSALTALYLALAPLIYKIKTTNNALKVAKETMEEATSLATSSRDKYEETNGKIRSNAELMAGFQQQLDMINDRQKRMEQVLLTGFCNMDEIVKKGKAAEIAKVVKPGEADTHEEKV